MYNPTMMVPGTMSWYGSDEMHEEYGISLESCRVLAKMNDKGDSFDDIAEYIEENWETFV
jgi:hypothetical protein